MEIIADYEPAQVEALPADWTVYPLEQLVTFLDGERRPVKDSDRDKMRGSVPYYGASGVVDYVNNYIFDDDLILLAEDGENILSRNRPLAFSVSGKIWVNNHAHVLKPRANVSIGYLTPYLESLNYERFNTGTAQPKLNKQICAKIPVALPATKAEQEAIAEALSDADKYVESLEQLIAKKRLVKQGAMQELLTGERRLPGFSGDWEVKSLGMLGVFFKGRGVSKDQALSGDLPCVRYGELYTRHNDYIRGFYSGISRQVATTATRIFRGDILFAGSGETKAEIGKCAALAEDIEAYAGGDIVVLRPVASDPIFLGYYLNTPEINLQKASRGQGDAVVHISAGALADIRGLFPEQQEQRAIGAVLSDFDAEIDALQSKLAKARDIKQGMMQNLLTGKVRLV